MGTFFKSIDFFPEGVLTGGSGWVIQTVGSREGAARGPGGSGPGRAPGRRERRFFVEAASRLKYDLEIVKKNLLDNQK